VIVQQYPTQIFELLHCFDGFAVSPLPQRCYPLVFYKKNLTSLIGGRRFLAKLYFPRTCTGSRWAASSVELEHRWISSSNTALNASLPCIVPRLVRGKIGRSSTRKYASFSTWVMGTCRCGMTCILGDLDLKEKIEIEEQSLGEDAKRFFKLFTESTFEGSRAAAKKMKEFAKRQINHNQRFLLFHSLHFLIRFNSEMLSWPNSPLLVML
jgi:hypothetical protein